jgi:ABC-type multidrug transport system permease subunit
MINTIGKSALIALQFLRRDFYASSTLFGRYLINFSFVRPLLIAISFVYIQGHVILQTKSPDTMTLLVVGNSVIIILSLACNIAMKHLFDRERKRVIDYQLSVLSPHFIILERVIFVTLYTFILLLPFFPMMKLFMGANFETTNTSWLATFVILFLGALCCSAYLVLALSVVRSSRYVSSLWMRVNIPLLWLGGLWAPLSVIKKDIPLLGFAAYCNPLTYVSEGLRSAILDSKEFIPVSLCALALILFSVLFVVITFPIFKKRTDHI